MITRLCVSLLLAIAIAGCQSSPDRVEAGGLSFEPDNDWKAQQPASTMRVAEYVLPGPALGDGDDALLVIYHFGPGGAGSVEDNLDRWRSQFESDDPGSMNQYTVHGLAVNTIDLTGRYIAETMPGSGERVDKPDHRMLGAIVTTPTGPYYIKLVGPQETVARWSEGFDAFIASLRPATSGGATATASHPDTGG